MFNVYVLCFVCEITFSVVMYLCQKIPKFPSVHAKVLKIEALVWEYETTYFMDQYYS